MSIKTFIQDLMGEEIEEREERREFKNGKNNTFHRKVNRDQEKVFVYECTECGHKLWRRYGERWPGKYCECKRCGLGRYKKKGT